MNPTDEHSSETKDGPSAPNTEEDDDGPVVIRPTISRSGSLKQKKKPLKSKLSFGGDGGDKGDGETDPVSTPKKFALGQRALENSAMKRGMASRSLPLPVRSHQDDDDRPKYSREYLDELQSSTPSTPRDVSTLQVIPGDEMELDASELEGALIVDLPASTSAKPTTTQILTDAEIRERKERRARLALEKDFLSVEDDDEEGGPSWQKKKEETRLTAEDEDLGEGFDDYVEDGGLSLGKRAEKERRKHDRLKMAEMIHAAEGHTSDSSSDSDAERRIAYESAQTRAGLDGLKKKPRKPTTSDALLQVPPKITPLPNLSECLAQLQLTLNGMTAEIKAKTATVDNLRRERDDIVKREAEVQALLDETGKKYEVAMGGPKNTTAAAAAAEGKLGFRSGVEMAGERGLESLGATPIRGGSDELD